MKKLFFLISLSICLSSLSSQTLLRSVLIDFGASSGTNVLTNNPDANLNYWNNFTSNGLGGTSASTFIDKANNSTPFNILVTTAFTTNNGAILGLSTGLSSSLGDLAIGSATTDCFFASGATASLKFTGLSDVKRYKFYIYGCRTATDTRLTKYTLTGSTSTFGTLTTSGTDIGGAGVNGNNSMVYSNSTLLYSDVAKEIKLDVINNATSGFGYINCLKLEEYKGAQAITFDALTTKTVGDADYAPGATTGSLLSVTYSSSNEAVATIVDNKIHIIAAGNTTITASQAGDATYDAATNVPQLLTVSNVALQSQTITFDALPAKNFGDANFALTATATSNLSVSYASSNTNVATVSANTVTIVGVGTTDITASQLGNGTYNSATNVIQTLTVNKAAQIITFGTLASKTNADASFALSGTSSSALSVSYTSSNLNVAAVSGNILYITGVGATNITASQVGNANFNAAADVVQSLTVTSGLNKQQSFYFDFGPKDITNGDETIGSDANGNFWNNISTATGSSAMPLNTPFLALVNSANTASTFALTFTTSGFTTNGKANGGLLTPQVSQFGDNSELAIATATEDYMYTGALSGGSAFVISALNPTKRYKFKVFGCRNSSSDRTGQYTVQGAGSAYVFGMSSSSATGLGGTVYIGQKVSYPGNLNVLYALTPTDTLTKAVTYYGNNSTVYNTPYIFPDASGNISITTITTTPTQAFAYINALKMEEFSDVPTAIENAASKLIQVSPTSFSNQISITGAEKNIEMFNAAGVKMLSQSARLTTVLNTNILSKGFYILVVDNKTSFKVIKK